MSLIDTWDADNECSHGWLPHESCKSCGRIGSKKLYPGVQAVAASERQCVREAAQRATAFTQSRGQEPPPPMEVFTGMTMTPIKIHFRKAA